MRFGFRERPWDIIIAIAYTLASSAVLVLLSAGTLVAILLILFAPGYVMTAALFPAKGKLDWIERIGFSIGLSITVVPLLGLLLNFTPWGIRFAPIIVTISLFTAGAGVVAYWRRMRLLPEQRLSATLDLAMPAWQGYSFRDKGLTSALVASIVVAGGALAYVVLTPRPGQTFTEFYILGPGGNASGYPSVLNVSQPGTVIVGIADHESASVNYTVRVDLVGVRIVYNATSGFNETVVVNRTTWSTFDVTLADGQNWTQPYTFRINYTGPWKVQFLLFKDGDYSSAYRELHLYVRVT